MASWRVMPRNTEALPRTNNALMRAAWNAPLLDAGTERRLLRAARAGDANAKARLVIAHMRLVLTLVPSFRRAGVSEDDLISEGAIGLLDALRLFDCERDNRFAVYARWWVRARLRRYVDATRHVVLPPSTRVARTVLQKYGRTAATMTSTLGRTLTREDMATALEVTAEDIASIEPILGAFTTSLTARLDGSCIELRAETETPEALLEEAERQTGIRTRVAVGLAALTSRERDILTRRFSADGEVGLAELGRELSISRERVRQIQKRACEKFRSRLGDARP